ncbi:high-affinity Fe2 transport protein [Burkholderia cepacia]|uniref:High-affinity Fe2 transport protein n=1 Tax=Burkholderia cepacia TaxID=292 RepID=A0AAE8T675_BURCE|nr:iron transporter [Burkholderia cepacia]POM21957.1 34 kDa membrane antigen [Burkholderia cepacia]SQA57606.1 high-affinity Fe2 transport protein [Burkholderia cepacia]
MLGSSFIRTTVAVAAALAAMSASAAEYPIGKQQIQGGMEIGAVYLQPITMDPEGMMRKASDSDIHLEADIHAVKNNPTGFAEGDWMPYLQVTYKLTKQGDMKWKAEGDLMGMVASDGPHYGDNVKLNGPGKYHLTMVVKPPMQTGHMAFGRHIDKETGVGAWFKPITLEYDFPFAGIGKKGGY